MLCPPLETDSLRKAGGLIVSLHIPFLNGGTVCLMGKFELSGFCRAIQTYQCKVRPTLSPLPSFADAARRLLKLKTQQGGLIAPPMALALAKSPIVDQYDLQSLDWLLVGAAPLSGELQRALSSPSRPDATLTLTRRSRIRPNAPLSRQHEGRSGMRYVSAPLLTAEVLASSPHLQA